MNKSGMYFKDIRSSRIVPLAHDVWTGDMIRTNLKVARQVDGGFRIVRQVSRQINNVHASDAELFFDVVY